MRTTKINSQSNTIEVQNKRSKIGYNLSLNSIINKINEKLNAIQANIQNQYTTPANTESKEAQERLMYLSQKAQNTQEEKPSAPSAEKS